MTKEELQLRFKKFAIDNAILISKLEPNTINSAYSKQLIRCSSSPGANYRAVCRAKSTADFINKLKIVEEETDESIYFLELIQFFNRVKSKDIEDLIKEGRELLAIIVASLKTSREKRK